jgi:hypothetical protein
MIHFTIQFDDKISSISLTVDSDHGPCLIGSTNPHGCDPFIRKISLSDYNDITERLGALCDVSKKAAVLGEKIHVI